MTKTAPTALSRPVRDVMRYGVVSVPEHASLESVARAMADHRVHAVLVLERSGARPLGWVKAETLLTWLNLADGPAHAHVAITELPTAIAPDATLREAIELLSRSGVSRLLVRDDDARAAEGVVTPFDIVASVNPEA